MRVRESYASIDELIAYDEIYNIAQRCGYASAQELWDDNPMIGGSVNPQDFGIAQSSC